MTIIVFISLLFFKTITKTSPCNEHPHTPHFYIVKLGFTGINIIFLFLLYKLCNVLSKNEKNITCFHLKIIIFTAVKYCCILHGRACLMCRTFLDCFFVVQILLDV